MIHLFFSFVPHPLAGTVFFKKSVPFYSQWMLQEFGMNAWIMFSFESWICPKLSEATSFNSKPQSKIFALSLKDPSFRDSRPFNQVISSFLDTEEQVLVIKSARPWPGLAFALSLSDEMGILHFSEAALSTASCRLPFPVLFVFNHGIWKDPPVPSYAYLPHQFSFSCYLNFLFSLCGSMACCMACISLIGGWMFWALRTLYHLNWSS